MTMEERLHGVEVIDYYARVVFEAHNRSARWCTTSGSALPSWDELPDGLRRPWRDAARAVIEEFSNQVSVLASNIGRRRGASVPKVCLGEREGVHVSLLLRS